MIIDEVEYDNHLEHYGILRRSGRYPYGSGGETKAYPWNNSSSSENVRNRSFLDWLGYMRKQGLSDADIAEGIGASTTQLRAVNTIASAQQKQAQISYAERLKAKSMSNVAAAAKMGIPESTFRTLIAPGARDRANVLMNIANMLQRKVDGDGLLDIGSGSENYITISKVSKEKLNAAVEILLEKGYVKHTVPIRTVGGKNTITKVLAPPGTTWPDVVKNIDKIKPMSEFTDDGGHTFDKIQAPLSINPKRLAIRYKEDGGDKADGMIYVREGVSDIAIGKKRYGQVRVQVGDGHYLKGMAMYKGGLPDGIDLEFHTTKSKKRDPGKSEFDHALKPLKDSVDLPFGSVVYQVLDKPGDPKAKVTSAMNLVNEAGAWDKWSNTLSSQFLSKQSPNFAKAQLVEAFDRRKQDYDEIMSLTNPTVKKKLLEEFAESTDSAAVQLKAASIPRQANKVILPISSLKETEVYAPTFRPGERVVLIRFPHGGTFEIPELTVNNRNPEAKRLLGDAVDAIGINHKVAQRLSGADFDGDTVLVIPNNSGKVKTSPALEGLKNFDPNDGTYKKYDGMPVMTSDIKGIEMGKISNLITDMTIKGASHDKLARAVRHSMVVIDAETKKLNYRQSAIDHGISALKREYQGGGAKGASTLISRKKAYKYMPEVKARSMQDGGPVDKETGRRVFVETGSTRTRVTKKGVEIVELKTAKRDILDIATDAHALSSDTIVERHYADHSNKLKALANQTRLDVLATPKLKYNESANKAYAKEVQELTSALAIAQKNAPRERQAQIIARVAYRAKKQANPDLEKSTLKKLEYQELAQARARMFARKQQIEITQRQWDAIQAGAISNDKLTKILRNADIALVRKLATPRITQLMTSSKTAQAQRLLDSGLTRAEVANKLGVSLTTLDVAVAG